MEVSYGGPEVDSNDMDPLALVLMRRELSMVKLVVEEISRSCARSWRMTSNGKISGPRKSF